MSRIHPQARTTPRTRAEINASTEPVKVLAQLYNITVATARKWHQRGSMEDRSHCPHKLSTVLTPAQEAVVVELRRLLLLPLDDLLVVTREFINPAVSRSGLDRCLRRHGVANLKVLLQQDFVAQTLRQQVRSSPMSEVAPSPKRYKTTNWPQYNAALKARGSLTLWLDSDMQWLAAPSGKRGRQHLFSDACIQFCLSMKCLFGLPLRQTLGLVQSLLQLSGAHWPVPDYSTVSRRQKSLTVELNYQRSGEGLHLLVDSTGIKFLGEGEWKCKKHGPEYRRQWRKVHLGIDAQTLEIRAIEVTDNSIGDAPMLPCLLEQIAEQEDLLSVSADGAYDTKACHEAIAQRGAQAIIPPRKNAKWWKEGKSAGAKVRNEAVKACQRFGHRLWKQWSGYHRRSLVETKMHCFKRLGERVMARTFERQVVELQVRVALLNRFTQLGRPVTVPVA